MTPVVHPCFTDGRYSSVFHACVMYFLDVHKYFLLFISVNACPEFFVFMTVVLENCVDQCSSGKDVSQSVSRDVACLTQISLFRMRERLLL